MALVITTITLRENPLSSPGGPLALSHSLCIHFLKITVKYMNTKFPTLTILMQMIQWWPAQSCAIVALL